MMAAQHWRVVLLFAWIVSLVSGQNQSPALEIQTLEEHPVGTLIGQISDAQILKDEVNADEFDTLTYRLLDNGGTSSSEVTVAEQSGNVYLNKVLDRETLCGFSQTCEFFFDVAVQTASNSYVTVLTIQVTVLDKNDNIPLFKSSFVDIEMPENDLTATYKIDAAEDKDVGNFSVQTYEIVQQTDFFDLDVTTNPDQSKSVTLILKQQLDREQQNRYQFHIVAKDGGDPPNSGTLSVSVEVLDDNDNAPEFLETEYRMSVKEKSPSGTVVLQVAATDKDIGINGQIIYRFSPHQSALDQIQDVFGINEQTGAIHLIKTLTDNPGKIYQFYVDASDKGTQPKITQQQVIIQVVDAGNNPPELSLSYIITSDNGVMNVSESAKNATPLVHVRVDDSDLGLNGNVSCRINDTSFTLQPAGKGFIVMINSRLDRETIDHYFIVVSCEDHGSPPLSSSVNFTVNITDENDSWPVFSRNFYNASILENSTRGVVVTQVSASDRDIGRNALIRYYLHNDSVSKFAINSNTGVITSNMIFDRELNPRITFRVLAVDNGNPQQTGTATVVLSILDINDNAPVFNITTLNMVILENSEPLTKVGQLLATDLDEGDNGRVIYSIPGNLSGKLPFIVYQDGVIRTKEKLDREFQSSYTFDVRARDHGNPSLETNTSVTVRVIDKNDNSPVFLFPNDSNDTVTIGYLTETPSWITKVTAVDRDLGLNKEIVYSIRSGNDLELFSIDPYTGDVYLQSNYQINEDTMFILTVSAEDNGTPRRISSHTLHVVLMYTNETAANLVDGKTGNKYIIISAVVVVLTVILSAVIIGLIVMLRRKDKLQEIAQKLDKEMQNENASYLENGKVSYGDKIDFSGCNGDIYKQKKKKEVSFSLDDDMDNVFDMSNVSAYHGTKHEHPEKLTTTFQKMQPYDPQNIQSLQLQQLLIQQSPLDSKDKSLKKLNIKSPHDDISDTSGETTTSDSGRGGSDMDMPSCTNMPDDVKAYSFSNHHGYRSSVESSSLPSYIAVCGPPKERDIEDPPPKPPRPSSDVFSSNKTKDFKHLTPRENFERKHNLTSSAQRTSDRESDSVRSKSSDWSPSYV